MKKHSKYPPSSAHRWLNCPASVLLPKDDIERDTTAADEGSLAHKLAELLLTVDEWNDNDEEISKVEADERYTPEMEKYVESYIDYIKSKDYQRFYVEEKLDLNKYMDGLFGTCDCILMNFDERKLGVIDFKYGRNKVNVKDNPQLLLYALGAADLFKEMYWNINDEIKDFEIELSIFQPRINYIGTQTLSYSDLKKWYLKSFKPAAKKIEEGNIERRTGDWCKWCDRQIHCGAYSDELINSDEELIEDCYLTDFFVQTDHEIGQAYLKLKEKGKQINEITKNIEKFFIKKIKNGESVDGFKLVKGRRNRSWASNTDVLKTAKELEIDALDVISPAQLESRIGKPAFKKSFEPLVKYTEGAPVLAKSDDKREAYES